MNKKSFVYMDGDEDQTIYTFRGSELDTLNNFVKIHRFEIVVLEENYRSKQNILDIANRLIHHNQSINKKNLFTSNKEKEYRILIKTFNHVNQESLYVRKVIEALHSRGIDYKDMAILYGNNNLSTPFEKELLQGSIPYAIHIVQSQGCMMNLNKEENTMTEEEKMNIKKDLNERNLFKYVNQLILLNKLLELNRITPLEHAEYREKILKEINERKEN